MKVDIGLKVCPRHPEHTKESHTLALVRYNVLLGLEREGITYLDLTLRDASYTRKNNARRLHFSMIPMGITSAFIERVPETYVRSHSLSLVEKPAYAQLVFTALCSFGNPYGDVIKPHIGLVPVSRTMTYMPRDVAWASVLGIRVVAVENTLRLPCT